MATDFNTLIEEYTDASSDDFTDAKKLVYANYVYTDLINIVNSIDPTRYERTSHADFTQDQTNFSLPKTSGVVDLVAGKVNNIWVKYTSSGDWYLVSFQPKSNIDFNTTYAKTSPVGWWEKDNFYILPTNSDATVTNGIKITFSDRPSALTAITDNPTGIDKEFWELIPLGVSYKWLRAKGQHSLADRYEREYLFKVEKMKQVVQSRLDIKPHFTIGEDFSDIYS